MIELQQLSQSMRDVLNEMADRRMAVLDPLKVTITNLSADEVLEIANHPQNDTRGTRQVTFSNELYIDKADFQESANKHFKRLVLDGYVRLRGAYIIKATEMKTDENGEIVEIIAEIVPGSLGKNVEGVKARGVIQWVNAKDAIDITINNYDVLFTEKNPQAMPGELMDYFNHDSLTIIQGKGEPALKDAPI
mgnify:CR=1 FL=1